MPIQFPTQLWAGDSEKSSNMKMCINNSVTFSQIGGCERMAWCFSDCIDDLIQVIKSNYNTLKSQQRGGRGISSFIHKFSIFQLRVELCPKLLKRKEIQIIIMHYGGTINHQMYKWLDRIKIYLFTRANTYWFLREK